MLKPWVPFPAVPPSAAGGCYLVVIGVILYGAGLRDVWNC